MSSILKPLDVTEESEGVTQMETMSETGKPKKIDKKLIITLAVVLVLSGAAAAIKFYLIPRGMFFTLPTTTTSNTKNESLQAFSGPSDYTLNSSDAYQADDVVPISNFEAGEEAKWQGDGIVDEKIYYEGARSLSLISTNRTPAVASLEKKLDLTKMEQIEFMLHITDADAFETVTLDFGELELKVYYRYTFSNLRNGWNLIQIPKEKFVLSSETSGDFSWSKVESVKLAILSRPASIFLVRIDALRSVNNSGNYQKEWRATKPEMFLSLYERAGTTKLMARGIGSIVAVIKESANIRNFEFSASISPQSAGRSGLFVRGDYTNTYGYYFLIGGNKKNTWQILKRNKAGYTPKEEITEGVLDGVVLAKDKDYWLKVTGKNNLLEFSFSTDGKQYQLLGKLTDDEFKQGGLGIAVLDAGWSLFDDIQFKKK